MSNNKNNRYNGQVSPTDILTKTAEQQKQDAEPVKEEKQETTPVVPVEEKKEEPKSVPATPVAAEPVKEVPKQEQPNTVVTSTTKVQQKTVSTPDPKDNTVKVAKLEALLERYTKLVSTSKPSEATRAKFVESFYSIAEYILSSDSYAVYNRFYDFFLKERNALVHRNLALAGIHKIRDLQKKSRISAFYAVVYAMVRYKTERKPFGLSIRAIRVALRNDKFCTWIQAKLNNRG